MLAEAEDLKLTFDKAAHQLSNAVLEIGDWGAWVVYFLEDLEMLAASLDPQHPEGYRAMLGQLKDDIETTLEKGGWKN